MHPGILSVGRALPSHYATQEELTAALQRIFGTRPARLEQFHRAARVGGRHLALPLEAYERLGGFEEANRHWIECALDLGARAVEEALRAAALSPREVDHFLFTTVTGIAVPSIDARLVNRMGFRPDVRRVPLFGLGCVAGAAAIARARDLLRGGGDEVALLLSVELCSLTLQRRDLSVANLVASGLFGDGAAAVLLAGGGRPARPRVIASRSVFYPGTEGVMGWNVTDTGLQVVLTADVPTIVRERIRSDVDRFLGDHGLRRDEIARWICHPGGPKVLDAFADALELPAAAFARTWRSLEAVGNLSSASVLFVLGDTLADEAPPEGSHGLLLAMGPGFCSELVLLRW